jgi:hypothetical protein
LAVVVVVEPHTVFLAATAEFSAASVLAPSSPSAVRPDAFWNSTIAASVAGPTMPSMLPL